MRIFGREATKALKESEKKYRHLVENANSIILAHNHPSGCLTPSSDDNAVTQRIARAGALLNIRLLDHVILAPDGRFYSYKNDRPDCLNGGES